MSDHAPEFPMTADGGPDWDAALDDIGISTDGRPLYRIASIVFRIHYRLGSQLHVDRMYVVAEDQDELHIRELWDDYHRNDLAIEAVSPEYLSEKETVAVPGRVDITEDTVRIRDDDGTELVTWTADEWQEHPEAVVPAILEAVQTAPVDMPGLKQTLELVDA